MQSIAKKICLVGDFSVGKTSLIRRFVDDQFSDQYLTTVGVKISRKQVVVPVGDPPEKKSVNLIIWDLEGNTQFKAIAPSYLQGATGAIMVADVTREDSIDHLQDHIKLFFSINSKGFIIIALNKSDLLSEEKEKKLMEKKAFFKQTPRVISLYTTSAKTGKDVNKIFQRLTMTMLNYSKTK